MVLDQPGHRFGIGGGETKAWTQSPRHARAGNRMILDAAFGDVVQEQRDVENGAVARQQLVEQLVCQRRVFVGAALDVREDADAPQQVLVDGVVMIHIELHHRDDLAEGRHETAEHAGLVHAPQHGLGIVLGDDDFQEQLVGFLVLAQFGIDQMQRARDRPHGVGMKRQIVLLRQMKDADQVDRIALEHVGLRQRNAVIVGDEILGAGDLLALDRAEFRHHAAQHWCVLGLAVFQFGADNRGEVADILGDQEVVLHEALDVLLAGMFGVAEPLRDLALDVESEAFFGAAGHEMHVTAHRPEKILAAPEQLIFGLVEHAALDQLVRLAHAIDVFRDPEQRVQIAQAAFAVFDVGLDQIARLS